MLGRVAAGLALIAVLAASCASGEDRQPLLVMAAASLTDAFAEIETAFEVENPTIDVQLNLAGSASLREQILQGAPADVFASANAATMTAVVEAGQAAKPQVFASNSLALAVPEGNPGGVRSIRDLADDDLLIGLCAEGVPCGDFARQALAQVGIVAALDTNEGDVRALVTKLAAGELDAGIVYTTDVATADELLSVPLPAEADVSITYPIAALTSDGETAPNEGSLAFIAFVLSDSGQTILATHGFGAP